MSDLSLFGFRPQPRVRQDEGATEYVMPIRVLRRVLALRRRTIDDVVNDPYVKNEIFGYWKLHKQVQRTCEIVDLERQWNRPTRRR